MCPFSKIAKRAIYYSTLQYNNVCPYIVAQQYVFYGVGICFAVGLKRVWYRIIQLNEKTEERPFVF